MNIYLYTHLLDSVPVENPELCTIAKGDINICHYSNSSLFVVLTHKYRWFAN